MTLDKVLRAAVNSMIDGHHKPHCYSAWVQGEGYVNDGSVAATRDDYLRQLKRTALSEIENMTFATEYAEPGYTQPKKVILFADWNHLPTNLDRILEKMGFEIEWSDEWFVCECMRAVRTCADSYDWTPSYVEDDGEFSCKKCKEGD